MSAGHPSECMPTSDAFENSPWQATNDLDFDLNINIIRDAAYYLSTSCNYHSIQSLKSTFELHNSNALSLLHYNVRGIISSYDELENLLSLHPLKIIGLYETFLNESNMGLYHFSGYSALHKVRSNRRGGGVALLLDNSLVYSERTDLSDLLPSAESVFAELTVNKKRVIVGEIYRPPSGNSTLFIEQFEALLSVVERERATCYLMGDMNINLMMCDTDRVAMDFLNCNCRHAFFPLINRPTRLPSATLIDHIYTNAYECLSGGRFTSGVLLLDLSDHLPVFHICAATKNDSSNRKTIFKFQLINDHTISSPVNLIKKRGEPGQNCK